MWENNINRIIEWSRDIEKLAEQLLDSPQLLGIISEIFRRNLGIVREKKTKLYTFLICLSAVAKNIPSQMLQLRGSSRSGKTWIADNITQLFNTARVGHWSAATWHRYNFKEKGTEILYFQELLGMDKESSSLRLISSEDAGFTAVFSVYSQKTRDWESVEVEIPPLCFITTTTRFDIDPQFENRCHVLNTDETIEQTRAIIEEYVRKESRKIYRLLGGRGPDFKNALKMAIRLLDPDVHVVLTMPSSIRRIFPSFASLRVRSDFNKLVALIKLMAFLYQKQRPYIELHTPLGSKRIIFALPQDVYYTFMLAREALLTMTLGLEARQREMLPILAKLKKHTVSIAGVVQEGFTRGDIADYLEGRGKYLRAMERLESLRQAGIVESWKERTGRVYYRITLSEPELEKLSKLHESIAEEELMKSIMAESREFFKELAEKYSEFSLPPDDMLEIKPCASWFDDMAESIEKTDFRSYPIKLGEKELTDTDFFTFEATVLPQAELWALGQTGRDRSEIYVDQIAKATYEMLGIIANFDEDYYRKVVVDFISYVTCHEILHALLGKDVPNTVIDTALKILFRKKARRVVKRVERG